MPLIQETEAKRVARLSELLSDLLRLRAEQRAGQPNGIAETDAAIELISAELQQRTRQRMAG